MDNKKILKNIIDAKRKNPYTENKTVNQLRKETETAGTLIPLPENIKYKSVVAGNGNNNDLSESISDNVKSSSPSDNSKKETSSKVIKPNKSTKATNAEKKEEKDKKKNETKK